MSRVRLYVSISPDLGAEREIVGRAVAGLPVDVGWEVAYTPGPLDASPGDPLQAGRADVYLFLLGADIHAPMGVEWTAAQRAGVKALAWLKDVPHTPAAQEFSRAAGLDWTPYQAAREVTAKIQLALAQAILDRAGRLQLTTPEWEALSALVKTLREKGAEDTEDARQGAGRGGVIFAPSREAGRGGVEIGR